MVFWTVIGIVWQQTFSFLPPSWLLTFPLTYMLLLAFLSFYCQLFISLCFDVSIFSKLCFISHWLHWSVYFIFREIHSKFPCLLQPLGVGKKPSYLANLGMKLHHLFMCMYLESVFETILFTCPNHLLELHNQLKHTFFI